MDVVLSHGGTLKAEHGTGRVMAPFVERQYGSGLHQVMRDLKQLCDPAAVLNPGVVLTDGPHMHLRHLKPITSVEAEVDRCVECGFCERVCASQDLRCEVLREPCGLVTPWGSGSIPARIVHLGLVVVEDGGETGPRLGPHEAAMRDASPDGSCGTP
jgi:ferredoxin